VKWTKPDFLLYRLAMLATGSLQPLIAVGLRLPDEAVRLAVAKPANHTHGLCEKAVNARGLHGLSCCESAPRQQPHSQQLNDSINTSNDVVSRKNVPFGGSLNFTFRPHSLKRQIFRQFVTGLENFVSKKALTMEMLICKLPLNVPIAP